jgi:hypothetical protein
MLASICHNPVSTGSVSFTLRGRPPMETPVADKRAINPIAPHLAARPTRSIFFMLRVDGRTRIQKK